MATPATLVRETFLVPQDIQASTDRLLKTTEQADSDLRNVAQSFAESLTSVIRTLSIPFQYTYSQVHSLHWQRIFLAARIRGGGAPNDEEQEKLDRVAARDNFDRFLNGDGRQQIADEVVERLLHLSKEPESLLAARELSRQGLVLTWSAVEVLARDSFVYLLNRRPSMTERLQADTGCKKRFSLDRLDFETLASFQYDLSKSIGTYLVGKADQSNLTTIRMAYSALFPEDSGLRAAMNSDLVWHLNQNRHLFVHRRGIADKAYIEATGSTVPVGEPVWLKPADVEQAIEASLELGVRLICQVKNAA